ncbi:MAG: primosomal replication protein N [Rhodocyclales bacterium]|nr:primosomal replication protein N [Rhodocyclales bacterium]
MVNRIELSGDLRAKGPLRSTPAGVPVVEFVVGHVSEQEEAGMLRRVECEMNCVSMGAVAGLIGAAAPGARLAVVGFVTARSLKNRKPVLHVKSIEFQEGIENGI